MPSDLSPTQLQDLAVALHGLLPDPVIRLTDPGDPADQHALAERLELIALQAGVDAVQACVIGDTIASYLGGWGGRYGNLDTQVGLAIAHLNLAAGGQGDDRLQFRPEGQALTVEAIAHMLSWLLMVEHPESD